MKKLRTFLSMDTQMKKLLLESFFYLAWARIQKQGSFSKLSPTLGVHMEETAFNKDLLHKELLSQISSALYLTSRYTFWESQCLVKALAAMKMLEKRQIESTLYLGTARDNNGEMVAHAWLRSGTFYVTGSEGMDRYTVVGKFAKTVGGGKA
ncbi:lasso peptide biosynthesis B2 protein [Halobacillus sp. BBL2006]|uniref:lasso peptide biosynthesis B2 protein n=1 Tax=Halobacillus sp. BBL2006 TaxID=1543706 RepID=UPI000542C853|nr:stage V sporulation protein S [Halobacillus sp. BBL2006]